jgi:hypothetical protein
VTSGVSQAPGWCLHIALDVLGRTKFRACQLSLIEAG